MALGNAFVARASRPAASTSWSTFLALLSFALPAFPQALIHGLVETTEKEQRVPIHEAAVRAFVDDEAIAVAFTDREGRYVLEVPAESFELRLVKPGYVVVRAAGLARPSVHRSCPQPGDCGTVDFLLGRAAAVEIWLADPSGDPFPRARVQLTPDGASEEASQSGETDDRGVKRFYNLAAGRYRIRVRPRPISMGLGQAYEIDSTDVDLRPGENSPIHLSARRAGAETFSFSGVIEGVDFDRRRYKLEIRPVGGNEAEALSLFLFGPELNVPLLPKGEYSLHLAPYAVIGGARPLWLGRIRADGNLAGMVLQPKPMPALICHVSFEERAPRYARLALRSDEGHVWGRYDVSAEAPNFTIHDAPPGRYTLASDLPDAFVLEQPVLHLVEGSNQAVQITLSAHFATVRGAVRTPSDVAAQVELSGPEGVSFAAPGKNGAFRFDKVTPGDYALCAVRAGEACPAERRRRFTVEPGDEVELELRVLE